MCVDCPVPWRTRLSVCACACVVFAGPWIIKYRSFPFLSFPHICVHTVRTHHTPTGGTGTWMDGWIDGLDVIVHLQSDRHRHHIFMTPLSPPLPSPPPSSQRLTATTTTTTTTLSESGGGGGQPACRNNHHHHHQALISFLLPLLTHSAAANRCNPLPL